MSVRIAISGKIGSGKSSIANALNDLQPGKVLSFATPLKKVAKDLYNMVHKDRHLLQSLGFALRQYDIDIFANCMANEINTFDSNTHVYVDDLRYENEYKILKKLGFYFVKLKINEKRRFERLIQKYGKEHAVLHMNGGSHDSEKGLNDDLFDVIIDVNKKSPTDLANGILQKLKE